MSVVDFPRKAQSLPPGWQASELHQIVAACSKSVSTGEFSGWEVGVTEQGEPQVYLIGPPPAYDCILCISRVGRSTVIEDGRGQVLLEQDGSRLLAEHALAALRRRKAAVLAQVAVAWQIGRAHV